MQLGASSRGRSLNTGCDGDRCSSWSKAGQGSLRLDLRPIDAVGVWASADLTRHELSGTGHDGTGLGWAVGGTFIAPLDGPRPAVAMRYSRFDTRTGSSDEPRSVSQAWALDGSAMLVLGSVDDQVMLWAGPTWTLREAAQIEVFEDEVEIELKAGVPVGLVLGSEFFSEPIGAPWKRTPRLSFGAEVRAIDTWDLGGWMALAY